MNKMGIAAGIGFLLLFSCNSKSLEEDLKISISSSKQNLISNQKNL
ncbi:hypothetical protein [Borreliella yangtzensis]|nr:hypothetical protein [Borreliella yangtzensis]WKC72950.1 hypothetical protein QIA35_00280 [Borreliella yangtzensis]